VRHGAAARNIKVSNYNARHDTSFHPSSIKSHETPSAAVIATEQFARRSVDAHDITTTEILPGEKEEQRGRETEKAGVSSNVSRSPSREHCGELRPTIKKER